jgi:hypothetical protein
MKKLRYPSALTKIEKGGVLLHPAFRSALDKLYGFACDEKGIRHASDGFDDNITTEDAIFFVVACSAFVNWLSAKASTMLPV